MSFCCKYHKSPSTCAVKRLFPFMKMAARPVRLAFSAEGTPSPAAALALRFCRNGIWIFDEIVHFSEFTEVARSGELHAEMHILVALSLGVRL